MKYITIPPTQPVHNLNGERMTGEDGKPATISFADFIAGRLGDPVFGEDMASVLSAVEIKKALDRANGVLQLDKADWARLKKVTEKPSPQTMYHPQVARALVPFMLAVTEASSEPSPSDKG
jgi:hypothetical protein